MTTPAHYDDPTHDGIGTVGLILYLAAVILFVLSVAAVVEASPLLAVAAGVGAVVSFTASLVIMVVEGRRTEQPE